jgi:GT2 family glycosyltransferase
MRLSYLIISYNRREMLLANLARLAELTPASLHWDAWVVDNGSTDGSADAVAARFPWVNLMRSRKNLGMPARNLALSQCKGDAVMLLDDDSYPTDPGAIARMLAMMESSPKLAAVSGRALLRDGREEASALPGVFIGCATMLRRSAVAQVGGFARDFFRQAEEYDLSFRLWSAGYSVARCEAAVFWHDKSTGVVAASAATAPTARSSRLVHRMDTRNNLLLADRYFPQPWRTEYQRDWTHRYGLLAQHAGHRLAAARGRAEARLRFPTARRMTLDFALADQLLGVSKQAESVTRWSAAERLRAVVIADYSKNIFATWNAARRAGLAITAIADDHPAYRGQRYRGISIMPTDRALAGGATGVILSNINPAQAPGRLAALRQNFAGPILSFNLPSSPLIQHLQQHAA